MVQKRYIILKSSDTEIFQMSYEYPDSGKKIVLPSAVTRGSVHTEYIYDGNGNITSLKEGDKTNTYVYDELNRLIRENNAVLNKTITYSYDAGGNLVEEKEYAFTTGTLPTSATKITTGTYGSTWKDQLLSWNGVSMTYDGCGNMLTKGSTAYTWTQGRRLSAVENGKSIKYYYDHTGARVQKEVDGTVTEYRMAGKLIVSEKTGSSIQWYHYDSAGNPYAADIGGVRYYFLRNLQGDVVGLIDASGNVVVEYQYDSWGNTVSITGSLADTVGQKNPFRYRGYYYDTETGLYYVGSRYYDAGIRRFISADGYVSTGQGILGANMFAYCGNNPVNRADNTGQFWSTIWEFTKTAVSEIGKTMGYMSSAYAGCGGVAAVDGPLPFGDAIGIVGAATLSAGAIGYGVFQAARVFGSSKSNEKAKDIAITAPRKNGATYYHVTTPANAASIKASGIMKGGSWEAGYVYAWRIKPSQYAIKNSGASFGVILSFKTNASFSRDTGIDDVKVQKYGPVVSNLPGPIVVWDVKIVGGTR